MNVDLELALTNEKINFENDNYTSFFNHWLGRRSGGVTIMPLETIAEGIEYAVKYFKIAKNYNPPMTDFVAVAVDGIGNISVPYSQAKTDIENALDYFKTGGLVSFPDKAKIKEASERANITDVPAIRRITFIGNLAKSLKWEEKND